MDGVVFAFRRIRGQFQHEVLYAHDLAVYFDARETLLEVAVQLLLKGAPFTNLQRGEYGEARAFGIGEHALHYVFRGVFFHLLSAHGGESAPDTGIQQA